MTTMTIDVHSGAEAKKIAAALRLMKSVKRITIQEDKFEPIPGLAYTHKERMDSIRRAEENIRTGNVYSAEEVRAMFPRP